jgi:DNA-binding MarR family transcriptional regulator
MTPARFDVVQLLRRRGPMLQDAVRKKLGVVKSSASELLAKLESLGFVTRSRARHRVGRLVTLTNAGVAVWDAVYWTQERLDTLCTKLIPKDLVDLENTCAKICEAFGSRLARDLYAFREGDDEYACTHA